jgi:hypothetical protein
MSLMFQERFALNPHSTKLEAPGSPPPTQFGRMMTPENDRFLLVACVGMFLEVADVEIPDFWPKFGSARAAAAESSGRTGHSGASAFFSWTSASLSVHMYTLHDQAIQPINSKRCHRHLPDRLPNQSSQV